MVLEHGKSMRPCFAATALAAVLVCASAASAQRSHGDQTRLYLVRHGQDTDNARRVLNGRRNTELTALGRKQAREAAVRLRGRGVNVDQVYSSPLRRAGQTASIVARTLKAGPIHFDKRLVERDFGVLTGKPAAAIPQLARKVLRVGEVNYFLEADGVESFPATYRRAQSMLSTLRAKHPGQSIALVTHGDIGKMLIAAARGWSWQKGLRAANLHNAEVVELTLDNP